MQEIAQEVLAYLRENPLLYAVIAFIAGLTASRTVASEGRIGVVLFFIVGAIGLFLGEFTILLLGLNEWFEAIPQFRLLFDFIAAYIGAFVVAALVHFIKPN